MVKKTVRREERYVCRICKHSWMSREDAEYCEARGCSKKGKWKLRDLVWLYNYKSGLYDLGRIVGEVRTEHVVRALAVCIGGKVQIELDPRLDYPIVLTQRDKNRILRWAKAVKKSEL